MEGVSFNRNGQREYLKGLIKDGIGQKFIYLVLFFI